MIIRFGPTITPIMTNSMTNKPYDGNAFPLDVSNSSQAMMMMMRWWLHEMFTSTLGRFGVCMIFPPILYGWCGGCNGKVASSKWEMRLDDDLVDRYIIFTLLWNSPAKTHTHIRTFWMFDCGLWIVDMQSMWMIFQSKSRALHVYIHTATQNGTHKLQSRSWNRPSDAVANHTRHRYTG